MLEIDIWHFSYFVLFQLTGLALYSLTKRSFSCLTAWAVLLLFTAQPLLLRHAFIIPKDIPFMAFMVFSIFTGYKSACFVREPSSRIIPAAFYKKVYRSMQSNRWFDLKKYINLLSVAAGLFVLSGLAGYLIAQIVTFF